MQVIQKKKGDGRTTREIAKEWCRVNPPTKPTLLVIRYTTAEGHQNMRRYEIRDGLAYASPPRGLPLFRVG